LKQPLIMKKIAEYRLIDIPKNEDCNNNKVWDNSAKGNSQSVQETLQISVHASKVEEYLCQLQTWIQTKLNT
jgi:hypothetical protein